MRVRSRVGFRGKSASFEDALEPFAVRRYRLGQVREGRPTER